jgi:hypothetical protein
LRRWRDLGSSVARTSLRCNGKSYDVTFLSSTIATVDTVSGRHLVREMIVHLRPTFGTQLLTKY